MKYHFDRHDYDKKRAVFKVGEKDRRAEALASILNLFYRETLIGYELVHGLNDEVTGIRRIGGGKW